jgi:integrase
MGASVLTDMKVRQAKARASDYKLADSGGLHLLVTRNGFKSWRFRYRFGPKEKRLVFGSYPEMTLAEARDRRDEARRMLREHRDPVVEALKRRLAAAADQEATFEKIARDWHELQEPRWTPIHASEVLKSLEAEVFPYLGALPIKEIEAPIVLAVLRKIEARGALETAKRVRQRMSAVFVHGISAGVCKDDPAFIVARAMRPAKKKSRQPAITSLDGLVELLRKVEATGASPVTTVASRLLALTAVRPGVLRAAVWSEFEGIDWDSPEPELAEAPLWRVPSARMKLVLERKDDEEFEHLVPLSRQAVQALAAIRPLTRRLKLVFPSNRHLHRPLSENGIGYLYNRAGYHGRHVPHGWRAAFSTIMNERAERMKRAGDRAVVDLMLAHVPTNKVEGAYNRAAYMERRREIAQEWADLLTERLAPAADLLKGPRRGPAD